MKVTTTIMSTTASTLDPGILFTADSPAVHKWRTEDSMGAKDSTGPVEQDSMGAGEGLMVAVAAIVET